jgi:hypothetical protein
VIANKNSFRHLDSSQENKDKNHKHGKVENYKEQVPVNRPFDHQIGTPESRQLNSPFRSDNYSVDRNSTGPNKKKIADSIQK